MPIEQIVNQLEKDPTGTNRDVSSLVTSAPATAPSPTTAAAATTTTTTATTATSASNNTTTAIDPDHRDAGESKVLPKPYQEALSQAYAYARNALQSKGWVFHSNQKGVDIYMKRIQGTEIDCSKGWVV